MKVLHLPASFFPDSTGGKEVFLYQLIKNSLPEVQHVVVLQRGEQFQTYYFQGIEVKVLPSAKTKNFSISYFSSVYDELPGFKDFLENYKPDIVHFHDQGEGASLSHHRICKELGIKTLLTYHSPGQSCVQRALLYRGKEPTDGVINYHKCTSCRYQSMGLPKILADIAGHLKLPIDLGGKFIKRNSTELFYNSWNEFYSTVDVIQVHAKWVEKMLLLNNIPKEKIRYVEMGGLSSLKREELEIRNPVDPIKFVYIGRCTDIKGVHLLVEAIKMLPYKADKVQVHFLGPYWDDTKYGKHLLEKIKEDNRFIYPRLVPPGEVIDELKQMDVCVIPSLWPETGPFTVFDAFAAGLPIIGTKHAGIEERVEDGVNGLLFRWGNTADLSSKLDMIINNPLLIEDLRNGIRKNTTFKTFSQNIIHLYKDVS